MQVKDVLTKTTLFFREKGFETARLDSELLIAAALKWERMKLYLNYEYPLSEPELSLCRELVRRRGGGEPVAYILGKKDFFNHTFSVGPGVLIPRPETERIVEDTVAWLRVQLQDPEQEPARIVDFGTGSGCIGLSVLAELLGSKLLGVDLSKDALKIAKTNAEQLSLVERATFIESDVQSLVTQEIYRLLAGAADAVVANPPYIAETDPQIDENVRRFEPASALFSGDSGLQHIRQWSLKAAELLRPGGFAMFEIGFQQGNAARELFEGLRKFEEVQIVKDLAGLERYVRAVKARD